MLRSVAELSSTLTISAPSAWCVALVPPRAGAMAPQLVAAGCAEGAVLLWDASSGEAVGGSSTQHEDGVLNIAATEEALVSASYDGVWVWGLVSRAGRWVCEVAHCMAPAPGSPRSLALSACQQYVACGFDDGVARVEYLQGGMAHVAVCGGVAVESIAVDGLQRIIGGCSDGCVRVWAADGTLLKTWALHSSPVRSLVLLDRSDCPSNLQLLTCASEVDLFFWELHV